MRAIAFILAAILISFVSEAHADGCQAAVARHNQAILADGRASVADFQKAFGTTPAAYKAAHGEAGYHTIEFCLKAEGMLHARISRLESELTLRHAAENACAELIRKNSFYKGMVGTGLDPEEKVIAEVKAGLADCASVIAVANGGTAPAPPSNGQAATAPCSDDVGPGMLLTNPGISLEGSSGCNNGGATNPQLPGAPRKDGLPNMQGGVSPQNRAPEVPGVSPPSPPVPSDNSFGGAPSTAPAQQQQHANAACPVTPSGTTNNDPPKRCLNFPDDPDCQNIAAGHRTPLDCPTGCHSENGECVANP
jgi:hypothetical protein